MDRFLKRGVDFISRPTHSRTVGLLIVFILLGAVSLTVIVAQQQQQIRQRAADDNLTCSGNGQQCCILPGIPECQDGYRCDHAIDGDYCVPKPRYLIKGIVYYDLNNNGAVDASDTVVNGTSGSPFISIYSRSSPVNIDYPINNIGVYQTSKVYISDNLYSVTLRSIPTGCNVRNNNPVNFNINSDMTVNFALICASTLTPTPTRTPSPTPTGTCSSLNGQCTASSKACSSLGNYVWKGLGQPYCTGTLTQCCVPEPTPTPTRTPSPTRTPTPRPGAPTRTPSPTRTPNTCYQSDNDETSPIYTEMCNGNNGTFKDNCNGRTKNIYTCSLNLCRLISIDPCDSGETCEVQPNGKPVCVSGATATSTPTPSPTPPPGGCISVSYCQTNDETDDEEVWIRQADCSRVRARICEDECHNGACVSTDGPTPTSTPIPGGTSPIRFAISLGKAGEDIANNPKNPVRDLDIEIFDPLNPNVRIGNKLTTEIEYDDDSKEFIGDKGLPPGTYNIKVKADRYLRKLVPAVQITSGQQINLEVNLIPGDINGDNKIDILDYSELIDCFGKKAKDASCGEEFKPADINDDGDVDGIDYNIFVKSLTVREGD